MSQRHAEIAGAGFAGLTAACALAQRGWSVRVHERADRLRTTGAGIYIYENGLRVLEVVGADMGARVLKIGGLAAGGAGKIEQSKIDHAIAHIDR